MKHFIIIITLAAVLTLTHITAVQADSLPDSAYITGFVGHAQGYGLSCESRSAADLAGYWGVNVTETEFLEALPRSDNPDEGFVGDPNGEWGFIPPHAYGVHADPIAATLREFGLKAEAYHHLKWDDLRAEIYAGRPVIVWILGGMWSGKPVKYIAEDGTPSTVANYEHTMVLVGYSSDAVEVVDAYTGQYQYYSLEVFLDSWSVLGNMAVLGSYEAPVKQEAVSKPQVGTYIVQPGDHLMALARTFGISWQELVDLNSISDPNTIYPGQVLQLPASAMVKDETLPPAQPDEYVMHLPLVQLNDTHPATPAIQTSPSVSTQDPIQIWLPLNLPKP